MISRLHLMIFVLTVLVAPVSADTFKGYRKPSNADEFTFTDSVHRVVETKTDFFILFQEHAAFYRFPKRPDTQNQMRLFLKKCQTQHTLMKIEVDPISAEVFRLSTP